jgi:hypothetical protein
VENTRPFRYQTTRGNGLPVKKYFIIDLLTT